MRNRRAIVVWLGGAWLPLIVHAQDTEAPEADVPDPEFLEYLGSWQADDDEWLLIAEWEKDDPDKDRRDRVEDRKREPKGNDDDTGT
jgi:hypothetical protein